MSRGNAAPPPSGARARRVWLDWHALGMRALYALAVALSLVGTRLPSALASGAAHPLPLWHLALFTLAYLTCLRVRVPISGSLDLTAGLAPTAAVLLIAGVPATLLMILAGRILLVLWEWIQCRRQATSLDWAGAFHDLAMGCAGALIAAVAAGIALLPFRITPWDGSRPWPAVLEIAVPLLVLVLAETVIDATRAVPHGQRESIGAVRLRVLESLEAVGLWKVCLVFLGLTAAVLYTTNLFWMLGLMGLIAFLQAIYGQRLALLQTAITASASLRNAMAVPAEERAPDEPDDQEALLRYSRLATERLATDRAMLAYKDEVVSLLAHDLRNPLSTMSGFATLVQRRARARQDGEQDVVDLQRILVQVKHMAALLDLLVVSSRGEADIFSVSMRSTDLGALVDEVIAHLRAGAPGYQWRLQVERGVVVTCDPDRITQVLTNVLQNALKYSPAGGAITVVLQGGEQEAILSVRDEGIGVPAGDRERIFDRFQRGSNVMERAPGLGAGLYIVSRIMQAHAGRVWVESEEGHGAEFSLALPRRQP